MYNKRSRNYYINANRFISFAAWKNNEEMFSLFPSFFTQFNIDKGLEIQVNKYIFCLGKNRFEINTGVYTPRNKVLNWKSSGLEDFIVWIRKNVNAKFDKYDMEVFLNNSPEWKKIITQSNCNNHYIRILLAKELAEFSNNKEEAKIIPENKNKNSSFARDALISSLNSIDDNENQEVPLDPLDQLGDALNMSKIDVDSWDAHKK